MDEKKPLTWVQMFSELQKFQLRPDELAKELGMEEADFMKILKGGKEPTENEIDRFRKIHRKWFEKYKHRHDNKKGKLKRLAKHLKNSYSETET